MSKRENIPTSRPKVASPSQSDQGQRRSKRGPYHDLKGKLFGSLKVVALHDQLPTQLYRWRCRCRCGAQVIATTTVLKNGRKSRCRKCFTLAHTEALTMKVPKLREQICKGTPHAIIAERAGCTQQTISRHASKLGLGGRAERHKRALERAKAAAVKGLETRWRELGVPEHMINRHVTHLAREKPHERVI